MTTWFKRIGRVLAVMAVMLVAIAAFSPKAYAAGWTYYKGAYYYVENSGAVRKNNWASYNGTWYYLGSDGKLATNRWIQYGGNYYYIGKDGKVVVNNWVQYAGAYYYMGADGLVVINDWVNYAGNDYYMGADGKLCANKTVTIDGLLYYFDSTAQIAMTRDPNQPLVEDLYVWDESIYYDLYCYRVPRITMWSPDADTINGGYEGIAAVCQEVVEELDYDPSTVSLLGYYYDYSVNGDVLSLVSYAQWDVNNWREYYAVCVNTQTGKYMSNEQVLQTRGITLNQFNTWLSNYLKTEFLRQFAGASNTQQYNDTISSENISGSVVYLDESGQLMVMTRIYQMAGPLYVTVHAPVTI